MSLKKFSKVQIVKEISRERVGSVPPTKVVPQKNKRKPKHSKRDIENLRSEDI